MRVRYRGGVTSPSLANAPYADTRSMGRTPDAPIALAGTGSIGVVMPTAGPRQ